MRLTLALSGARVITNAEVRRVSTGQGRSYSYRLSGYPTFCQVDLMDGRTIRANRCIVATGIGKPRSNWLKQDRLLTFRDFMASMDSPFPLRGMRRVAVIGAGDSGKTVVEALTGQGPTRQMSVASLDWPDQITWYGQDSSSRNTFEGCNRPRYKRLATLLDDSRGRQRRVRPLSQRVQYVEPGLDCIMVDGVPFDLAIDCTGFMPNNFSDYSAENADFYTLAGMQEPVARRTQTGMGRSRIQDRFFYVGPCTSFR